MAQEKTFRCVKCGKEKKKSEGMFIFGGKQFCCEVCCGDTKNEDHEKKAENICEFC